MSDRHSEFSIPEPQVAEVVINRPANVLIMNPLDYYLYTTGQDYHYYGGHFKKAGRIKIEIPEAGTWHLVVNTGGLPGAVQASFRLVPNF